MEDDKNLNLEQIVQKKSMRKNILRKTKEWICRYGPAEIMSTIGVYLGYTITKKLTGDDIAAAYGATIVTNIGFYGTMLVREIYHDVKVAREEDKRYGLSGFFKTSAKLFSEFGLAEPIDTLFVRPGSIYLFTDLLGDAAGSVVGKLVSDVAFYAPAIISYEIRKRIARKNDHKHEVC